MAMGRMIELVDQLGNHVEVDAALEVVVDGRIGYLEGNAHTTHGRMHIYFPHLGHDLTRSLVDIDSMTDGARFWIDGFLAGTEPSLEEYLGIQHLGPDERPEATEAEFQRWQGFTARFRATGECPDLRARPVAPLMVTDEERAQLRPELKPWAWAGERVWVPSGSTWVEADPQPDVVDGELAGTLCAHRGYPSLMQLATDWVICLDCDQVTPA